MYGDFTTLTVEPDPVAAFLRVLPLQGRVTLEADTNEQTAILLRYLRMLAADVFAAIGVSAVPAGAFTVTSTGPRLALSPGRLWVDGLPCELAGPPGTTVPVDVPDWDPAQRAPGRYLAYLDAYEVVVNSMQRPSIAEIALGGRDTAERSRLAWNLRLVLAPIGTDTVNEAWAILQKQGDVDPLDSTRARLQARTSDADPPTDPCSLSPARRYRGLENRLYRVEVVDVGGDGRPTLGWSRDNGSVVFPVLQRTETNQFRLGHLGRYERTTLIERRTWVQVVDEVSQQSLAPVVLHEVMHIDPATNIVEVAEPAVARPGWSYLRRWDGVIPSADHAVAIPIEDGIEIRLTAGRFEVGDYWMIPARVVTGDVVWPTDPGTTDPAFQLRVGTRHAYAPLAFVNWADRTFT